MTIALPRTGVGPSWSVLASVVAFAIGAFATVVLLTGQAPGGSSDGRWNLYLSTPFPVAMLTILYVTCPDVDEAKRLSRMLVEERLAACTNLHDIDSIYAWEGELVDEDEVAMLVKTHPDKVDDVVATILDEHPYDVPCVIDLGVAAVNDAYGEWIEEQTAP